MYKFLIKYLYKCVDKFYTMCYIVTMVKERTMKQEQINFRLSSDLLEHIVNYANERRWTKSFTICEILNQFFVSRKKDS